MFPVAACRILSIMCQKESVITSHCELRFLMPYMLPVGEVKGRRLLCWLLAKMGSERLDGEASGIWKNVVPKGQGLRKS